MQWTYVLVGNSTSSGVDDQRDQVGQPYGRVQITKKYSIWVKNWAEIIGDARHRHKFVQHSLDYKTTHDAGIDYLRRKHREYLPDAMDGHWIRVSRPQIQCPSRCWLWVNPAPLWTAGRNDDHADSSRRRPPGVSTNSARGPETTGSNRKQRAYRRAIRPAPSGPQTDPHDRGKAQEMAADQHERSLPGYFSSWRAMTTRWIWLVPS